MRKFFFAIVMIVSFCSCGKRLGDFVYVDGSRILHTDRECRNIAVFRSAKPLKPFSTTQLLNSDWDYTCAECVDEKVYTEILRLSERNEKALLYKRSLYDRLSKEYDMGTFEQFCIDVSDREKRLKLYDAIKDDYELQSFSIFSLQLLGIDSSVISDDEEEDEETPCEPELYDVYDDDFRFGRTGH